MNKPPKTAIGWGGETEFEKRRGVSTVEVREGYAQVHVSELAGDLVSDRLAVLEAIYGTGVSLDFLKLTPSGLSFLIRQEESGSIESALQALRVKHSIRGDRAIVLVSAVNIRDEEGLLADLVHRAISSAARVDHISDMHDRLLMVVPASDAPQLRQCILEAQDAG